MIFGISRPVRDRRKSAPAVPSAFEGQLGQLGHARRQTGLTPSALAANANMFLDDFMLFDVAKPITDNSHLEIEKSTLNGQPYQTGGGRTVDADVIDVLLTWMVNRDREFLEGGTTKATKPGTKAFRTSLSRTPICKAWRKASSSVLHPKEFGN